MVSREDAIKILNDEKDYEDKIVEDMFNFMHHCLSDIKDITKKEEEAVNEVFSIIGNESRGHSLKFSGLIKHCLDDGKDNY